MLSVGRRHGKAVMFVENLQNEGMKAVPMETVTVVEGEEMDTDQPKVKRVKV